MRMKTMFGSGETKEISGHSFRIAKSGLDEAEVSSYVESLTKQNTELSDKLENLDSLTRFATKVMDEAESVAEGIKADAVTEGKARAASIIVEGEQTAATVSERIIAEANENARCEAARLQQEADLLRATKRREIAREMRERFETVCADFLSGCEGGPEAESLTAVCHETVEPAATEVAVEETCPEVETYLSIGQGEDVDCQHVHDNIVEEVPEAEDQSLPVLEDAESVTANGPEEWAPEEGPDAEPESTPQPAETSLYEGEVQLRIPPPVSLHGLMALHRQLKENPDIQVGDVTGSAEDGASLELHLPTRVPLLKLLESLHGVERVSHVRDSDSECSADGDMEKSLASTIQLTVS
jgi:hypothetical protein